MYSHMTFHCYYDIANVVEYIRKWDGLVSCVFFLYSAVKRYVSTWFDF